MAASDDGRPDNLSVENEMLRVPREEGVPPRPATTPREGAEVEEQPEKPAQPRRR